LSTAAAADTSPAEGSMTPTMVEAKEGLECFVHPLRLSGIGDGVVIEEGELWCLVLVE